VLLDYKSLGETAHVGVILEDRQSQVKPILKPPGAGPARPSGASALQPQAAIGRAPAAQWPTGAIG